MTIREHPLAWRWTDPEHSVLPEDTLAQMASIQPVEAEQLWRHSVSLVTRSGLAAHEFATISRHSADVSRDVGRAWLQAQQQDSGAPVIISWDQATAIRTTWEVFSSHWDAFCYPASDDVLVFPDSEEGAVLFPRGRVSVWASVEDRTKRCTQQPPALSVAIVAWS